MSLYNDLRQGVRNAVIQCLPLNVPPIPVVFSHNNGEEPDESYVIIYIETFDKIGAGEVSGSAVPSYDLQINNRYVVRTQISFIGSKSGEYSTILKQNLTSNPVIREAMQSFGMNVSSASSVRRSPQQREGEWVEYHNIYVNFTAAYSTLQAVDVIDSVTIDAVYVEGSSETQINLTIP